MATEPQRRISPPVLVVAVVAAVALVGFLLLNLLGGGDEPPPAPTARPGAAAPPAALPPTPAPTPEAMEVFELFEGRDPFRPLLFEGAPGTGSPAPGESPAPASPPPGGESPRRTAPPRRSGVQVEVLSVAPDSASATVRVGSQVHQNARAGQTLSSGVVLQTIEGRCVNFRRGRERFRLCEGEQVLK